MSLVLISVFVYLALGVPKNPYSRTKGFDLYLTRGSRSMFMFNVELVMYQLHVTTNF
ncbi:hypothetical protein KC19_9G044000 [Ceratodon purpureus]|uniref:Uncharacterized protein n=1 Tax=Ceratodon purpureus TaxID=3225 RepID=A0A8T0GNP3_CERPU|nr:hypothetical protein KC19_9G044000 [Ceratodon purpureus]